MTEIIEYLMEYGWAILIILIAAGMLTYYGIFALERFLVPPCINCYDIKNHCYESGCTCEDFTKQINPNNICGFEVEHYTIPEVD